MRTNRRAMLFALESQYNDGSTTPEAATDALLMRSITVTPLSGSDIERNFIRPYYGNSPKAPGEKHVQAEIEFELSPSGTVGTAPAWGKVLRSCGWSEVIEEGVSVTYSMVSSDEDSGVFFAHVDGTLHKGRGAHGSAQFTLNAESMPVLKVTLYALISPVTKAELPTVDLTNWVDGLAINTANTEVLQVFGAASPFSEFSFDQAGDVKQRKVVGANDIAITGRSPSGSFTIDDPGVETVNFFEKSQNAETGALKLVHGKEAGSIIEFNMPSIGIESPSYADGDGVQMLSMNYAPQPVDGDDEVTIVLK
ncbi:phage tail tube protein [Halomonas sabkhae]|uniref:phage tail tube protein n=1 Tax=Halomonas sabkhae TaxID=626223 RepID=UPI0025B53AF4|nr:phage tail tube protein [Halomonas sabkhae]MDN3524355.1 phage tail tube protein [Halomonas sabkhae]